MFAASKTDGSAVAPDAQFNYVTMLLHGDGTNGAQNNTFVDSSTNNFTITRNGNTTQGSFSPYGSNWSNYFGSASYLSAPASAQFDLGTGNFTVEFWLNIPSTPTNMPLIGWGSGANRILRLNSTTLNFESNIPDNVSFQVGFPSTLVLNSWNHIALVRNGNSLTAYLNGAGGTAVTYTGSWGNSTDQFNIGFKSDPTYFVGYMSNLRIVKGTAVYTSNFTPSTTPLTAISGTALLTCQSNRFIDNSSNAFAITVNGTPSVQRFNPFGTSTEYSTSVIGGSGYFDGSGDYLTAANNAVFAVGTGNFTIEAWVYPQAFSSYLAVFDTRTTLSNGGMDLGLANSFSGVWGLYKGSAVTVVQSSTNLTLNNWQHIAAVRSGSTVTLYLNGVSVGSATDAQNFSEQGCNIGRTFDGYVWNGYISNLRFNNSAVYTSAFTPPAAPLTAITNTQLLLQYTNGAIFDNAMMNNLETVGNAQISTSVKKYGTGSIAFDGTDDVLSFKNNPSFAFGTGSFTIEFWINGPLNNDKFILEGRNAIGTMHITTGGSASTAGVLRYVGSSTIVSSNVITDSTWHHCAIVRNGSSNITLYVDGVSVGTGTDTTNYTTTTGTFDGLGGRAGVGNYLTAYIDDFRITKGYARYTANFTAPTAAFPNIGPI
jgi:hypothetical protein